MRREADLHRLDGYIVAHIGPSTTRHASETRFACPPLSEAVDAEQAIRTVLHTVYDGHVVTELPEAVVHPADDLSEIKDNYWSRAQHVTATHRARPDFKLDDYFQVGQDRHYDAIKASIEETHEPGSVPRVLTDCLDSYRASLGLDGPSASRVLFRLFNASLPDIKKLAHTYRTDGVAAAEASTMAIRDFAAKTVPDHITNLELQVLKGTRVESLINKSSLYPTPEADESYADMTLPISKQDAEGLVTVYHLQDRPYDEADLAMADQLVRTPAMQRAILLFQESMVDFATGYMAAHPERMQHSLEPYNEIFVPITTESETFFAPNPKLIKVISNNTLPAIAKVLREAGGSLEDLTGDHVQKGIELAKKLRIFQTQIGQLNNYDAATGTVELSSMFKRTCPAMQMFSEALARRLPDLYDSSRPS
jgi:hypothetical protein